MIFREARIEILIPLFTGVLSSMLICAVITVHNGTFKIPEMIPENIETAVIEPEENEGNYLLASAGFFLDPVLEYFRNPEYHEWVIEFFSNICSDREIVIAILENADKFDVSPALAFALSWEESKFNPNAVNRFNSNGSIDRGLFQLNSLSFPNLESSLVFDIYTNAYYGLGHLRFCLNSGGTEVSALAMYNAGTGRVRSSGAPEVTLNYISRILENRQRIESRFHAGLIKEEEIRLAEALLAEKEIIEEDHRQFLFSRTLIIASPL